MKWFRIMHKLGISNSSTNRLRDSRTYLSTHQITVFCMSPKLTFNMQCQARNTNFYLLDTSILWIYLFILTCVSSWNMSGTPRRPAPGCCRGGWRCLWRRGCTGTCKPSRNLPWKTIHSVGRLNQAPGCPLGPGQPSHRSLSGQSGQDRWALAVAQRDWVSELPLSPDNLPAPPCHLLPTSVPTKTGFCP